MQSFRIAPDTLVGLMADPAALLAQHHSNTSRRLVVDPLPDNLGKYYALARQRLLVPVEPNFDMDAGTGRAIPLRAVYTPLHGVGWLYLPGLVAALGLPPLMPVAAQANPDGTFPTVPNPSPEESGSLDLAFEVANAVDAHLILANDPDADRVLVAERARDHPGGDAPTPSEPADPAKASRHQPWTVLSTDVTAQLLYWWLSEIVWPRCRPHQDPAKACLVTTDVAGLLFSTLQEDSQACVRIVPTGFKWVADAIHHEKRDHARNTLLAYEPALGILVLPELTDKDGLTAAVAIYNAALYLAQRGMTLITKLRQLEHRHGQFCSCSGHIKLLAEGAKQFFKTIFHAVAPPGAYPATIAGRAVSDVCDLDRGYDTRHPDQKPRLPPSLYTISYFLDNAKISFRPSGTEVKYRIYVAMRFIPPRPPGEATAALHDFARQAVAQLLPADLPEGTVCNFGWVP